MTLVRCTFCKARADIVSPAHSHPVTSSVLSCAHSFNPAEPPRLASPFGSQPPGTWTARAPAPVW